MSILKPASFLISDKKIFSVFGNMVFYAILSVKKYLNIYGNIQTMSSERVVITGLGAVSVSECLPEIPPEAWMFMTAICSRSMSALCGQTRA